LMMVVKSQHGGMNGARETKKMGIQTIQRISQHHQKQLPGQRPGWCHGEAVVLCGQNPGLPKFRMMMGVDANDANEGTAEDWNDIIEDFIQRQSDWQGMLWILPELAGL